MKATEFLQRLESVIAGSKYKDCEILVLDRAFNDFIVDSHVLEINEDENHGIIYIEVDFTR